VAHTSAAGRRGHHNPEQELFSLVSSLACGVSMTLIWMPYAAVIRRVLSLSSDSELEMTILVTGGAGYIGSHTCVELISNRHPIVILDNFSNSQAEVLERIERITGVPPAIVRGDVRDSDLLKATMIKYQCHAVIHFAGLKSVGESVAHPLEYYDVNVVGTLRLVQAMQAANVCKLVFSSSATVYGEPTELPLEEGHRLLPFNPYGRTKLIIEEMLSDLASSSKSFKVAILRYFNPAGAHESGLIGEDPSGEPNNLMPFVAHVAVGRRSHLNVFGTDYDTPDGTGVRDYVHVMDLASGHLRALECLEHQDFLKVNLGTGRGTSVLELVHAFSEASGKYIPVVFAPRRTGDIACCYASPELAEQTLGWRATRELEDMCKDSWRWQSGNPYGYKKLNEQA
jgi:UDP-glucose 4-epimerase